MTTGAALAAAYALEVQEHQTREMASLSGMIAVGVGDKWEGGILDTLQRHYGLEDETSESDAVSDLEQMRAERAQSRQRASE